MKEQILALLNALDAALQPASRQGERLELYHIGRSACILHYGLPGLITNDVDVLRKNTRLETHALAEFGQGSARAQALGL